MVNAKNQLEDIKASITAEQALRKESVGIYMHVFLFMHWTMKQVARSHVLENYNKSREELVQLNRELESYGDADPAKFEETKRSIILAKEATLRWTGIATVFTTIAC